MILLSQSDAQLQTLLGTCFNYSLQWRIKFNPIKSQLISFGKQYSSHCNFYLNNNLINSVENIDYLGVNINENLESDSYMCDKFKNVQKSVFSLSFLGLKPMGVSPNLQSFIYKTYCLSTFTYGLETTTLLKTTRDYLNICQNNLIRQIVGLRKYCRMSNIRKCLKVFDFEQLYIFSKLSFINTLINNEISFNIMNFLKTKINDNKKGSKSFNSDLILLSKYFNVESTQILMQPLRFKKILKDIFIQTTPNGLIDSIKLCLLNFRNLFYKNLLNNLIDTIK